MSAPACGDAAPAIVAPRDDAGPPWFEECAAERGLVFRHESGHAGRHLLPEIMCGGAALFDMDGDGDLDAYLVQGGRLDGTPRATGNRLFANRGGGRFDDVTADSGAEAHGYGMGVAAGDFDDDGRTDLYVTNVGPNVLLRNLGGGRFEDVTERAGVGDPNWGSSAAFLDYDRDGDLDLFVVNYVRWSLAVERPCDAPRGGADYCSPKSYGAPSAAVLYRNDGGGRFTDFSQAAGIRSALGNGLGVLACDFDGDGREDVFVANDGTPNHLWMQKEDGTFAEEALLRGCAMDMDCVAKAGMGVESVDADDDGDPDLLVANLSGETDSFYRNDRGQFADRTASAGIAAATSSFTRFGIALRDFDHDGLLDLYVATGRVTRTPDPSAPDYEEQDLLFRGAPGGRLEEVRPRGGVAEPYLGATRGCAIGDVDGDGALDLLTVEKDAPARLYRNVVPARGAWTALRVLEASGRDALGARVAFTAGGRRITRWVRSASGYCTASDPTVHVGLGAAAVEGEIEVRWADGALEAFPRPPSGELVTLRRGTGRALGEQR